MCGATSAQNSQVATSQQAYNTALQNSQAVFGASSTAFKDLMGTFAPTVAAGPSQQGFSGAELANDNSEAITQVGQEAKNEKAAVGNAEATQGGGVSQLPSGASVGADLSVAENAGNQTASELSGIQSADYATGRQNYDTAVAGLESAPSVFGASTSATGAASGAGDVAGTAIQNQSAAQQSGWQLAAGALGGIAGAATGPILNKTLGNATNTKS